MNDRDKQLARAAAARFMPTKPAVKPVPEPKQVIKPKYVHPIRNKAGDVKYRAIVRIDRIDNRLGDFPTMAYAVQAQKNYCIERGTTYEAVFNAGYPKNRKGSKS